MIETDYLYHYGIKNMKWGVRRYQNADGSLTAAGKQRYSEGNRPTARKKNVTSGNGSGVKRRDAYGNRPTARKKNVSNGNGKGVKRRQANSRFGNPVFDDAEVYSDSNDITWNPNMYGYSSLPEFLDATTYDQTTVFTDENGQILGSIIVSQDPYVMHEYLNDNMTIATKLTNKLVRQMQSMTVNAIQFNNTKKTTKIMSAVKGYVKKAMNTLKAISYDKDKKKFYINENAK